MYKNCSQTTPLNNTKVMKQFYKNKKREDISTPNYTISNLLYIIRGYIFQTYAFYYLCIQIWKN